MGNWFSKIHQEASINQCDTNSSDILKFKAKKDSRLTINPLPSGHSANLRRLHDGVDSSNFQRRRRYDVARTTTNLRRIYDELRRRSDVAVSS